MAVTIKTASGETKPARSAVDLLIEDLAAAEEHQLGLKLDTKIAYALGFGSPAERGKIAGGLLLPIAKHFFTTPNLGDALLPEGTHWQIGVGSAGPYANVADADGKGLADASAKSPFAAFAICLLTLKQMGIIVR